MKILLVEDEEMTANILAQELTTHHYTVEIATDGQMGLELAQAIPYNLLILDIVLPNLDGINLCRQLRSHGSQIPILLLSAKENSSDRVMGLEAGADDYVIKPYERPELIARIQALLRRGSSTLPPVLTWEKLQLQPEACQVTYDGQLLHLTPKEYGILELFLRNPRRIFSRSAILDHIWPSGEFPQEDAVSTQIKGLRQKLKGGGMTINLIETVYGLGYRLKALPEEVPSAKISQKKMEPVGTLSTPVPVASADKWQAQAQVQAAVKQLWDNFKANFESRIGLFEQAIAQISTGTVGQKLQISVQREAHRLIGSLGSFGLPQGSEVARQIEQLLDLESLGENEARQLEEWVGHLKQIVDSKPSTMVLASGFKVGSGRLLVVDGDTELTQEIQRKALIWGFQVEVTTDLTTARSSIASYPPDVILLDLTFPQTPENGMTLLAELAQHHPQIPVLVLTTQNELGVRVEVARLGGNVCLEKPISPEEILKAVSLSSKKPHTYRDSGSVEMNCA